ncbi:hypothetical protein E2C01_050381 [Portunus trituberculatus]|uniref:Uncharacterized protein n=1 Tax=Portunus trituberculatus TaxID=210409 RepID=A0A5B7G842_PORTR|nr:hypothetical protein [Portunus trituberculatus]
MENLVTELAQAISEAAELQERKRRRKINAAMVRQDLTEEIKEELVVVKQQCEGRSGVVESEVDGRPCPEVVDTGAAKTVVGEEVVAVQDLPVSDWQLCGVTGHCTALRGPVMSTITVSGVEEKLPAFVADMEDPCLVGLNSLVQSAACGLRKDGNAARRRQVVASSDGHEMDRDAGEASPALSPHVVDLKACTSSIKLTPEQAVKLEKRMEATRRQMSNNCRHAGQAMTRWYQLRTGDAQYVVGDHGWRYSPNKKRGITLKKLENY